MYGLLGEAATEEEVVELARPRRLRCRLAIEEEQVRLHALRVEHPGRQPQQRVNVALASSFRLTVYEAAA